MRANIEEHQDSTMSRFLSGLNKVTNIIKLHYYMELEDENGEATERKKVT